MAQAASFMHGQTMKATNLLIGAALCGLIGGVSERAQAQGGEPPAAKVSADTPSAPNPMAIYFPEKARKSKIGGVVVVSCVVRGDGHFETCQIVREAPLNYGFGVATLKMIHEVGQADLKLNKPGDIVQATINWRYSPDAPMANKAQKTRKRHARVRRRH